MAKVCYHSGRHMIKDPYFEDLIQEMLPLYREKVEAREAFGLIYGGIKLSYQKGTIYLMREIYRKYENEITGKGVCEVKRH